MVQHVYQCAKACPEVSEVYVATDDERILECVGRFGGKAVLTAGAHPCGTDRVAEAATKLGLRDDDIVVNVQGDQPAFHPQIISQTIAPLREDPCLSMSTLKHPIRDVRDLENPNCVKVVTDIQGYALLFSRSPIPFYRDSGSAGAYYKHLGFYGYRMGFLTAFSRLPPGQLESAEKLEQLRALENGFRIRVVETSFDSIEVDAPADIRRVEKILARRRGTEP